MVAQDGGRSRTQKTLQTTSTQEEADRQEVVLAVEGEAVEVQEVVRSAWARANGWPDAAAHDTNISCLAVDFLHLFSIVSRPQESSGLTRV